MEAILGFSFWSPILCKITNVPLYFNRIRISQTTKSWKRDKNLILFNLLLYILFFLLLLLLYLGKMKRKIVY